MILYRYFHLTTILCVTAFVPPQALGQTSSNRRVIVLTDISSLSQHEAEPDDGQSLIRFMLYTNELEVEGLIATSNLGHGQRTRPELIRRVVNTYGKVRPNLLLHDKNFPSESNLMSVIKNGQPVAGPKIPLDQSIGPGKDTEGSDWIIQVVDRKDPRPVWIVIWGGSADLAQALWKVRSTRTSHQLKEFVSKLRVHAVYDQDQTGTWLKSEFPELFYIFRHHGIRGMYRGGDTTLVRSSWVETNIRTNHGELGALYVNYRGGDVWSGRLGRVSGIKEGDSPSFLSLLSNGLNEPDQPELGNWGGRLKRESSSNNLWTEGIDSIGNFKTDPDQRMASLYRWRPAWQADFAARLDWCVKPFRESNHPPRINEHKIENVLAASGEHVQLSAPIAIDPDGNDLYYNWFFYPEEGNYRKTLPILSANEKTVSFLAPVVFSPGTIHVILQITDNGMPALSTYKRFIVLVEP